MDLGHRVDADASLEIVTFPSPEGREVYWHSTAHVMAQAVQRLFPQAKVTIGPSIDGGFYYDFDVPTPFTPDDLVRIEERMRELITEGTIMVDVTGEAVGQVNGLAVLDLGDIRFGKPSRITAKTFMGRGGIVNIERESKLSGKSHDKGVLILQSYLSALFVHNSPLALNASIVFEQEYSGVEGDSASCAGSAMLRRRKCSACSIFSISNISGVSAAAAGGIASSVATAACHAPRRRVRSRPSTGSAASSEIRRTLAPASGRPSRSTRPVSLAPGPRNPRSTSIGSAPIPNSRAKTSTRRPSRPSPS